jgi:hypothetical protein
MSEINVYPKYFEKRWPLWGPKSSLVAIGVSEMVVSCLLLGNFNDPAASKETLGYSFHVFLVSAGAITFTVGTVNVFAVSIYLQILLMPNAVGADAIDLSSHISTPYL